MFWYQKAELLCTNQQRANTLQTNIQNAVAGFQLVEPARIYQETNLGTPRPALIVIIEYVNKADADSIWNQITTYNTNGWIVHPSFAVYTQFNDDDTYQILGRIDW